MKLKLLVVWAAAVVLAGGWCGAAGTTPGNGNPPAGQEPLMLDLSRFFWERFVTSQATDMEMVSVSGRQVFDGLPFQVDGRACVYGRTLATEMKRPGSDYPDIIGVKVGRAFDELHLLHAAQWNDLEGELIAKVRLNYADGTHHEYPITFGGQVRDWQRLQSEEREVYTDPDTKVIWRGPGRPHYKSTTRMSKTRLVNPFPERVVSTIDFVSTGKYAAYDVAAATVANRDPNRPVTPPVPLDRPERTFDGSVVVRVVDEAGQALAGAFVSPNISVAGSRCATIATPFYTAADGMGQAKYPKHESACIYFEVDKEGWDQVAENPWLRFHRLGGVTNQMVVTIRMVRLPSPGPAAGLAEGKTATSAKSGGVAATSAPAAGAVRPPAIGSVRDSRPHPILIIDCPVGANVNVEYSDRLASPVWKLLTVISNVPASPYLYECGREPGGGAQRFYRAVCSP